jgi:hypothetical protein
MCGQNVEFVTIKTAGTNSDYWALKSYGGPCPLSLCFLDLQRVEKIGNYERSRHTKIQKVAHINDLHLLLLFRDRYRIVNQK